MKRIAWGVLALAWPLAAAATSIPDAAPAWTVSAAPPAVCSVTAAGGAVSLVPLPDGPSRAGRWVYLDPQSGRLVVPPAREAARMTTRPVPALGFAEGVTLRVLAGGVVQATRPGGFRVGVRAERSADGTLRISHQPVTAPPRGEAGGSHER
jgi:hypothetical protein